jgi:hypothetical protein
MASTTFIFTLVYSVLEAKSLIAERMVLRRNTVWEVYCSLGLDIGKTSAEATLRIFCEELIPTETMSNQRLYTGEE